MSSVFSDILGFLEPIEGVCQRSYLGEIRPFRPSMIGWDLPVERFKIWPLPELVDLIERGYFVGTSPERALRFLEKEARSWVGEEPPGESWKEDPEFWDQPGKEAVKTGFYARRVAPQVGRLVESNLGTPRYNMILVPDQVVPGMPCILSIHFEPIGRDLFVTEVFRSVEVRKNLVNDLMILTYLIHFLLGKVQRDFSSVNITLFMVNPHSLVVR